MICNSLDLRNFYGIGDNETATDYDENFVIVNSDYSLSLKWGRAYYRASNGKLVEYSDDILSFLMAPLRQTAPMLAICGFPFQHLRMIQISHWKRLLLIRDLPAFSSTTPLLSISTRRPGRADLQRSRPHRGCDCGGPTDVNLLMTKNDVDESWPCTAGRWTPPAPPLSNADLDDDGLHLSGDGITNAKYATENADTENVDSGTISVQPDRRRHHGCHHHQQKSSSGDSLEIVTPSAPTTGNAITITNGFAYIDDPEQPVNSAAPRRCRHHRGQ